MEGCFTALRGVSPQAKECRPQGRSPAGAPLPRPRRRCTRLVPELSLWETARAALRLLADDPRPAWAEPRTTGFRFYLEDGTWVAYDVDEEEQLVTVLGASAAPPSARAERRRR